MALPAESEVIDWPAVEYIDAWLDAAVSADYRDQPLAQDWARTCKVIEELGEAIERLIKFTGQNPRKPSENPQAEWEEFMGEMADVVFTAIFCMQHFAKDSWVVRDILRVRLERIRARAEANFPGATPLA